MIRRRLRPVAAALLCAAALVVQGALASAQTPAGAPGSRPAPDPGKADAAAESSTASTRSTEPDDPEVSASARELGARLGMAAGGRITPGGLRIGGSYAYQLSATDWFEGGVDFIIGGTGAGCSTDSTGAFSCDHGTLSGRSAEVSGGIRRFLAAQKQFTPYVHVRLGVRAVSYPGDDVRGVAVVVMGGGGVRARVHDLVTVGGGATLDLGGGVFGRGLGGEPQGGLSIYGNVEFLLE